MAEEFDGLGAVAPSGGSLAGTEKFGGWDGGLFKTWLASQLLSYIRDAIVGVVPGTMDTLDEIAAALADDASFAATMTTQLAGKQAASAVLTFLATASAGNAGALRTLLGLVIGTDVQAQSSVLAFLAGASSNNARAVCALLGTPYTLAKSGVQASHTGDTSEHTFATITIPAGAMGPNGQVEVIALFTATSNANNKTARIKLGATNFYSNAITSANTLQAYARISNRNAQNSQVGHAVGNTNAFGVITGSPVTTAQDTSAAVDITLTGQLANSADTITLESYIVKLTYGA